MKLSQVNEFQPNTPEFIVAHARHQQAHGRQPSMVRYPEYRYDGTLRLSGEFNPRRALKDALAELVNLEVRPGEHVATVAFRVSRAANMARVPCTAVHNEVPMRAEPGRDAQKQGKLLERFWDEERERRDAAWKASPVGQAYFAEREAEVRRLQAKLDMLMASLRAMDETGKIPSATPREDRQVEVGTLDVLLAWCVEAQDVTDHVGVKQPTAEIIAILAKYGFRESMCTDADYTDDPWAKVAYLIGQAMSCLAFLGAIHGIIHSFAERWRKEYNMPHYTFDGSANPIPKILQGALSHPEESGLAVAQDNDDAGAMS